MKQKIIRIASVIMLLAVMTAVFFFSAEPADRSQETSDGFIFKVVSVFYPKIKTMTEKQWNDFLEKVSNPVRKFAHFSIYGLMGVFSILSIISYRNPKYGIRCIFAWLVCILYAVSDEIHQFFSAGRSCEFRDMLIDSSGALLGIVVMTGICIIVRKRVEKHENRR